ncbi:N6-adenosine-methyltransferase MT-A70-like protein [Condylostylus longicornis]|uniref:N6-adenosine-methyltransferase MT-A70-like protein n=1 Tax=Condylostylus longicornis TaxID=2530218 RepID=UPI00244DD00F|nr:N6-adenosine-methyltransferase MT-A70-like protein [Condylostylus longicornis]
MSDAWDEIQAIKSKRNSFRERLEKRKKERQDIFCSSTTNVGSFKDDDMTDTDLEIERMLLQILSGNNVVLPINSIQLTEKLEKNMDRTITKDVVCYILRRLDLQGAVGIKNVSINGEPGFEVISINQKEVIDLYKSFTSDKCSNVLENDQKRKYTGSEEEDDDNSRKYIKILETEKKSLLKDSSNDADDIMSLLSMPSTREKQSKQVGEEILELLTKPTAKERSLAEKFKSHGGAQVMEFCPHGTKIECLKAQQAAAEMSSVKKSRNDDENSNTEEKSNDTDSTNEPVENAVTLIKDDTDETTDKCTKLHFKKIIQAHTDESLGDCSFLNTCFHMITCKYVHYEVDAHPNINNNRPEEISTLKRAADPNVTLYPPQWIQCDLRYLDMTVLGKFAVVMADPPWDIHMELPYGTMSDDEMRQLGVPALQDDGLIFLWVTGRAMELGRECLKLWGYERVDELLWVKTNQLQRIIRTGRTGHWLNHGKEHCLVGMKGNPKNLNRGLDCDVIVAEVRATSHKPDEIYGIIERLSPGTRKIELFGRPHNVQPNWITLGNQLDGIRLIDPELITSFRKRYPDGNCMAPAHAAKK